MTARVLVTGANKGIGRAIVRTVLEEHDDAFVFLGSRDRGRGEATRAALIADLPYATERLEVLELDVADEASVQAAAEHVRRCFESEDRPLYGIVNNAGIGFGGHDTRAVLEVNVRGIHRVCVAFLPLLRPDGRIVNVTSAAGPNFVSACRSDQQRFFLDRDQSWSSLDAFMERCLALSGPDAFRAEGLGSGEPYGLSKACANLYTLILAREHPELVINAVTPGYVATDLTLPRAARSGRSPVEMGMKTPEEGARAPVDLLFGPVAETGRYFGSDGERSPFDRYRSPGSLPHTGEP